MTRAILIIALVASGATVLAEDVESKTIYSPFGKRDPFRPPSSRSGRQLSSIRPLERFSIEQFRLRAILRAASGPSAMFTDPQNQPHVVREGQTMGKEQAIVSRILDSEVILTQKTVNYLGAESLVEKIVSLPEEDSIIKDATAKGPPAGGNPSASPGAPEPAGTPSDQPFRGAAPSVESMNRASAPTVTSAAPPPDSKAASAPADPAAGGAATKALSGF